MLGWGPDTLVGRNVVAVVNPLPSARLATLGRVLHFNYVTDPTYHSQATCLAADGSKTPIPRGVASNVSTTACDSIMP